MLYCYDGNVKDAMEMAADIASSPMISKINLFTWQKEYHFLTIKKSISAPKPPGYYTPNMGEELPTRRPLSMVALYSPI